jgi:glutathione synthase
MTIKIALQMDPLENIDITGDTSFALGIEAQRRGFKVYHYTPKDLTLSKNKVIAGLNEIELADKVGSHFKVKSSQVTNLEEMDVILIRQDPPFDMAYITNTYILEHIKHKTLIVNDPSSIRSSSEKLFATYFNEIIPPTLITANPVEIRLFRAEYKEIIIKPLYGNGGAGVFYIKPNDENMEALIEMFLDRSREPVIVQKYLPQVRQGDKRIILLEGEIAGAINRVPALGESRSNMHVGGKAEKTNVTEREREICSIIRPELKKRGLILVGIDVIGGLLTEINVTSPTGIREINTFNNVCLEKIFWNIIEDKLHKKS